MSIGLTLSPPPHYDGLYSSSNEPAVGEFIQTQYHRGINTVAYALGELRVSKIEVRKPVYINQAQVEVSTGAAGTVAIMVYKDNGASYPGKLFLDTGNQSAAVAAWKTFNFTRIFMPAGVYWAGAINQGGAAATLRGVDGPIPGVSSNALPPAANANAGYLMTGVTGAAPGTWTSSRAAVSQVARVLLTRN